MSKQTFVQDVPLVAAKYSWLTERTYLLGCLSINAFLALGIAHVLHSPAYEASAPYHYILSWAIAVNLLATVVLLAVRPTQDRALPLLWLSDWMCALLPVAFIVTLRASGSQAQYFGFAYAIWIFARVAVFVVWINLLDDLPRKTVRLMIFASSFIIYFGLTPWLALSATTNGDEPHYLLLSHSLIHDHDFDLRNNYDHQDYKAFYPHDIPTADRHIITNARGQQMPFHDVGLSILLVPGYAIGNRLGAMIELNFFAAILAVGIFELACELGATTKGAIAAWALFAFVSPLVTFSSQVYPEVPDSALAFWAAIAFARFVESRPASAMPVVGCLMAIGPWLSVRYWVVLASMGLVIAVYLVTQIRPAAVLLRDLAWLALPTAISLLIFCIFDLRLFGRFEPNAGYILFVPTTQYPMFRPQVHVGLLGLFFDGSFGVLPTAPIYLVAVAGIWQALRARKVLALALLAPIVSTILFTAPNHWWYGGVTPPPSRYIVMALAPLAAFAGVTLSRSRSKILITLLAIWSFVVAFEFIAFPIPRHSFWNINTTGVVKLVYGSTRINLAAAFPSFLQPASRDYFLAGIWGCIALLLILAIYARLYRRQVSAPAAHDYK